MFCQKCGTENKDDASFCSKCGNDLKSVNPEIDIKDTTGEWITAESLKRIGAIKPERKGITGKLGKMGIPGFRSGKTWKMALATLVYIFIGIPIFLGFIQGFFSGLSHSDTNTVSSQVMTSPAKTSIDTPAPTPTPIPLAKIGDRVVAGNFAYTYHGMTTSQAIGSYIGSTFYGEQASGKFIILDFTIENIGDDSESMSFSNINIVDDQGRTFEHNWNAEVDLKIDKKEEIFNNVQLQPGLPKRGKIVFDVPQNLKGKIELYGGLFSKKRYISLTVDDSSTQNKVSSSSIQPTPSNTPFVVTATPTGIVIPMKILSTKFSILNKQINAGDEILWNNFDETRYTLVELDNKITNITIKDLGRASYIFNISGNYRFGLYYPNMYNSPSIQIIEVIP